MADDDIVQKLVIEVEGDDKTAETFWKIGDAAKESAIGAPKKVPPGVAAGPPDASDDGASLQLERRRHFRQHLLCVGIAA